MVYILTPVRAVFEDDIKTRENLLEKTVGGNYPVGFEIVFIGGVEGDLSSPDKICRNLEKFSSNPNFYLSVHSPCERDDYTKKQTDLTTGEGLETLAKVLDLAQKINARLVNVHSENFHLGKDLLKRSISFEEKRSLQDRLVKGLVQVKGVVGYEGVVTIENMPYPLMGDDPQFSLSSDMPFDPIINTAQDILYFSKEIGICIDTCHYGISQKIFNSFIEQDLSLEELKQRGYLGITSEDLQQQPSLTELSGLLGDSLQCVHLSDFEGIWVPEKSFFKEGLVPGEGEYEGEIREFVELISNKPIPVNVEVGDNDFKNPAESERAIKHLLKLF